MFKLTIEYGGMTMGKTIVQKIFDAHLRDEPVSGNMVLDLDVVMCHEITTPIAIIDLMEKGMDRVFDPRKIKAVIDHVSPAKDSKTADQGKIMRQWVRRHNIKDFYDFLQKDVVIRHDVRDKDALGKMAVFLMSNSSKIVSIASIKKSFNLSYKTAQNYLEYLKEAFLVFKFHQFNF